MANERLTPVLFLNPSFVRRASCTPMLSKSRAHNGAGIGRFDTPCSLQDNGRMKIELAKDVEDFLEEQVRAGACADATELANDVLRCLRELQRKPFSVTPELEAWLLEAGDKPGTPLTRTDFDRIREQVRTRTQPRKA